MDKKILTFRQHSQLNEEDLWTGVGNMEMIVKGKKLIVFFYDLDDWDSSGVGGGRGEAQAFKDIELVTTNENDPLVDQIYQEMENRGYEIDHTKKIKLKNKDTLVFKLK